MLEGLHILLSAFILLGIAMIFVGCVRERFEPGSPWGFASATENICILKRNRPKKRSLELQKRPGRV